MEAQLHLANTRAKLAVGSPLEALHSSVKAAVIFTELGRTGLLGVTLHLRSLALLAAGRRREALQAASDAVEILSGSHPRAHWLAKRTLAALRSHRGRVPTPP